jgi:hypothetical protein
MDRTLGATPLTKNALYKVVFQYWLLSRTDAALIVDMQRDKKQKT